MGLRMYQPLAALLQISMYAQPYINITCAVGSAVGVASRVTRHPRPGPPARTEGGVANPTSETPLAWSFKSAVLLGIIKQPHELEE